MSSLSLSEQALIYRLLPSPQHHTRISIEPITSGLTNRNYLVQTGHHTYVVRIAGAGTELLGIDRAQEAACARAAAKVRALGEITLIKIQHPSLPVYFPVSSMACQKPPSPIPVSKAITLISILIATAMNELFCFENDLLSISR